MNNSIIIIISVILLSLFVTVHAESFCVKNANDLGLSQLDFMSNFVDELMNEVTKEGSILLPFFDGTNPPGSVDYVSPGQYILMDGLKYSFIAYFGNLTECTDNLPEWKGNDLAVSHENIPIGEAEYIAFMNAVSSALNNIGVLVTDKTTLIDMINNSVYSSICNQDCDTQMMGSINCASKLRLLFF